MYVWSAVVLMIVFKLVRRLYVYVCMYECMYVCMYVCICYSLYPLNLVVVRKESTTSLWSWPLPRPRKELPR